MIYAAFSVWLFLTLLAGMGVYSLWTRLVPPGYVNWALLPGTIVSEMAYIFGSLITGGEIRRAKIMPEGDASAAAQPPTEAAPRLKIVGPIAAALICIVACAAAIIVSHRLLGQPVIHQFETVPKGSEFAPSLPMELPTSWDGFWRQADFQLRLLRQMCATWVNLDWLQWRTALFVYLAMCMSVRLAPAGRPFRATLAAVVLIAAIIALIGAISKSFGDLMADVWPLLSFVWAMLLFLLATTLLIHGLVALIRSLASGGSGGGGFRSGGGKRVAKEG